MSTPVDETTKKKKKEKTDTPSPRSPPHRHFGPVRRRQGHALQPAVPSAYLRLISNTPCFGLNKREPRSPDTPQKHPDTFTLSVSHTTRRPRPGERDGVEYHFVTKEAFLDLKAQDGFIEKYASRHPPPQPRSHTTHTNNRSTTAPNSATTSTAPPKPPSRNKPPKAKR